MRQNYYLSINLLRLVVNQNCYFCKFTFKVLLFSFFFSLYTLYNLLLNFQVSPLLDINMYWMIEMMLMIIIKMISTMIVMMKSTTKHVCNVLIASPFSVYSILSSNNTTIHSDKNDCFCCCYMVLPRLLSFLANT